MLPILYPEMPGKAGRQAGNGLATGSPANVAPARWLEGDSVDRFIGHPQGNSHAPGKQGNGAGAPRRHAGASARGVHTPMESSL